MNFLTNKYFVVGLAIAIALIAGFIFAKQTCACHSDKVLESETVE